MIILYLPLPIQFGRTAMMEAAAKGRSDVVTQLINAGAKVDATDGVSINLQVSKYSLDNRQHGLPAVDWEGRSG